jgi:subtilisin
MRKIWRVLLVAVLATGCTSDSFFDTYIVKLNVPGEEVFELVTDLADEFDFEPIHIYENATTGFQVRLPIGAAQYLQEQFEEIEYIVIDNPDDMTPEPDEDLEAPDFGDDEVPEAITRIGGPADFVPETVVVAVVDTGVDLDHPDLNVYAAMDIVAESGGSDYGGDDPVGHGTHVAGTIGAIADGEGVAGVAPGVAIYAIRVLEDDGSGTIGDIVAGLEHVLEVPEIRVVNLSLGGIGSTSPPAPLKEAIETLEDNGVTVCIAAGNEGSDTEDFIPAGYDVGIVVSAYDTDGGDNGFAYFSNYGDAVDIAGPGVSITSTYPDGDYAALSGTSMATPHVAGAAAAYLETHEDASPGEVLEAILATAEDGFSDQGGDHPESLLSTTGLVD